MTRYYRLYHELEIPGKWYLGDIVTPERKEILPVTFTQGLPIAPMPELVIVPNVIGKPVDFTFQTFQVPVVSVVLAQVVEDHAPSALQRIPVTIAPDQTGFEILNVIRTLDCLDYENSSIEKFDELDPLEQQGKIKIVSDLHIVRECAEGNHLFRLGEWKQPIIISETLKLALQENHFTGMAFIPV